MVTCAAALSGITESESKMSKLIDLAKNLAAWKKPYEDPAASKYDTDKYNHKDPAIRDPYIAEVRRATEERTKRLYHDVWLSITELINLFRVAPPQEQAEAIRLIRESDNREIWSAMEMWRPNAMDVREEVFLNYLRLTFTMGLIDFRDDSYKMDSLNKKLKEHGYASDEVEREWNQLQEAIAKAVKEKAERANEYSEYNENHPANAQVIRSTKLGAGFDHGSGYSRNEKIYSLTKLTPTFSSYINEWTLLVANPNGVIYGIIGGEAALKPNPNEVTIEGAVGIRLPPAEIKTLMRAGAQQTFTHSHWHKLPTGEEEFVGGAISFGDDWVLVDSLWSLTDRLWQTAYQYAVSLGIPKPQRARPSIPEPTSLDARMEHAREMITGNTSDQFATNAKLAIQEYTAIIQANPRYAPAYHQRGGTYDRYLKDQITALADYDSAIAIDPKYAMAYFHRAKLHHALMKGDASHEDAALADFLKAGQLLPSHSGRDIEAQQSSAQIYAQRGQWQPALELYNRLILRWQELRTQKRVYVYSGAEYFMERADLYKNLRQIDKAIADYHKAGELSSSWASKIAEKLAELQK
jgi:tetratricopeptide (TPR) repeat protein